MLKIYNTEVNPTQKQVQIISSVDATSTNIKSGILYSKLDTGVIAAFQSNGRVKPLYFQYKDLCGESQTIKIDTITSAKEEHYAGFPVIVYFCNAMIDNHKVECLLRFRITEQYWELLY